MKFRVAANLVGNYKTFARRAGYAFILIEEVVRKVLLKD